ncbi:hypothetical protein [Hyphomonas sp.]|uniref:hypothetical protein n=1 Tax=Hyphomonas sp. TaxID=87 RepID=UPI003242E293
MTHWKRLGTGLLLPDEGKGKETSIGEWKRIALSWTRVLARPQIEESSTIEKNKVVYVNPRRLQIPPPNNWTDFEALCHQLFKAIWNDPTAQKNGRVGQAQHGVDIWGYDGGISEGRLCAVQCKGKNQNYGSAATTDELEAEALKACKFSPKPEQWVFATTAPRDVALQEKARELSRAASANGGFTIHYMGWDDIEDLLCDHTTVLREFYPNHADDIPALIEAVKENYTPGNRASFQEAWSVVDYKQQRDFRAALLGRRLGPQDVSACPQLVETSRLVSLLESSHSARLVGLPGAGKSVCAHQCAYRMLNRGYTVYQLIDPHVDVLPPLDQFSDHKCLLLIDDAHLMKPAVLDALERVASPNLCILSTLNVFDEDRNFAPGMIALDAKRAVRTIANALRSDWLNTLRVVSAVDSRVGERMMDEDLAARLDAAENGASQPWQFSFVLGGGWQRASQIADNARGQQADIVLAIAAALQVATRDAPASFETLSQFVPNMDPSTLKSRLSWLVQNRMLIADNDYRTPHQRFATILIGSVLKEQDSQGREQIAAALNALIVCPDISVLGLRNLLFEIAFAGDFRKWTRLVKAEALEVLADRLWKATSAEERHYACLTLCEFTRFGDECLRNAISGHEYQLVEWARAPLHPTGFSIGDLFSAMRSKSSDIAETIIRQIPPEDVAKAVSEATPETAFALARLISGIGQIGLKDWQARAGSCLDRDACIALAANWPIEHYPGSFSSFCGAIAWWDEELSIEMAEAFSPIAAELFAQNPITFTSELDDIIHIRLGILDILGVCGPPSARCLRIGRSYIAKVKPMEAAQQLAATPIRHLQSASFFLTFVKNCNKRLYEKIITNLPWDQLGKVFEREWRVPSHDVEVFVGVISATDKTRALAASFIENNLNHIVAMPPRWALVAPDAVVKHVKNGGQIQLCSHGHFEWDFAPYLIHALHEQCPECLPAVLAPCEETLANAVSATNASWLSEAAVSIFVLIDIAPDFLSKIIRQVDVAKAKQGWVACLRANDKASRRSKYGARDAAALLIEFCLQMDSPVGELARDLRKRFPKASMPRISSSA